ncbi:rhamnan synthesis F family protein [Vibrio splendidus]|uniref:Lipopolysaccharide biosynthesis protein n=1 Tax=Vibrio splendidus TaxID=29497 RepID=A0A2N7JJ18_VIBSP|nr:rhamnan synthesis F family protein [Vibrio splendidus]PMM40240.1 hypothetical protein BCT54_12725 [Vibrio splendidus]
MLVLNIEGLLIASFGFKRLIINNNMFRINVNKLVRKISIFFFGGIYIIRYFMSTKYKTFFGDDSVPKKDHANINAKIAVIVHLYYESCWKEMLYYLSNIDEPFDLYISLGGDIGSTIEDVIVSDFPQARLYRFPNIGRDIFPFLKIYRQVDLQRYDAICKIHSKKSTHRIDGSLWRHYLFGQLLGNKNISFRVKEMIALNNVGLVSPRFHKLCSKKNINDNEKILSCLISKHGESYGGVEFDFVGGSMFWFSPSIFIPINDIDLADFEPEEGQLDGTLSHAIERYFGYLATKISRKIIIEI